MIKGINIPICLGTLFFIILFTFFVYIICSESTEPKEERDDLINPFWIEDRDLGRGEVDHLSGVEIQFWKDLIDKYLSPIDADKKREVRYSKSYFLHTYFNLINLIHTNLTLNFFSTILGSNSGWFN